MLTRRKFIGGIVVGGTATSVGGAKIARSGVSEERTAGHGQVEEGRSQTGESRRELALKLRQKCALHQHSRPLPLQVPNDDERNLSGWIGNFTKGLPHTQTGEVEPGAYESLLAAVASGESEDFDRLARGSGRPLVNPQAAYAFHLEGGDSCTFSVPQAPSLGSAQAAAEMTELYWQSLARDIPFGKYEGWELIQSAAEELAALSGFRGPKRNGAVTADVIFRGPTEGDLTGPYISQFLWKPIPIGSSKFEQRYRAPIRRVDYLVSYPEWLQIQTGVPPWRQASFEQEYRYIVTGRDLAEYVHFDFLYQAFLNAALILENMGPESLLNTPDFLSVTNPYKRSKTQTGFVTLGCAHIADWLGRVTTACMKTTWFQKWAVHRRLRPEEFGGRVHQTKTNHREYPIHRELLGAQALEEVYRQNGTYLLPQSYTEGCPLHPAYPAGHATVAGACATILKAYFDETMVVADCVVPSRDGRRLEAYEGPALMVKGEVEKLAFNIAMGRNFAGIHYRSDAMAGMRLGEEVAITVMEDLVNTLTEDFDGFKFTRFDGESVHIRKTV
jgi:hypothetical protein